MIIDKANRVGTLLSSTSQPILDLPAKTPLSSTPEGTKVPKSISQEPLVVTQLHNFPESIESDREILQAANSSVISEHSSRSSLMVPLQEDGNGIDEEGNCRCGWFSFRPDFLKRFNNQKGVLVFLCMASCLQGLVVNGFVNSVITSIERRFELQSTDSGIIAGSYDVGTLICLVPVTYFGGHASKPLLIGLGMIVVSFGSFIFSFPHFSTSPYSFSVNSENVCRIGNASSCESPGYSDEFGQLSNYKYMFFFGQLLHGIGYSPLYTLGVTYIDESVSTKMSSVYLGIFYLMSVIGPALGYVLGGQLLKLYTDFHLYNVENLGLSPSSNIWVGAWWLGFLIASILAILVGVPLTLFPRELPDTKKIRIGKISETHQKTENSVASKNGFGISIQDLPKSLKILIYNPTFIFISFAGTVDTFILAALSTFLPKYIEAQFNLTPSWAAFLMGLVTVLGAGSGMIIGGYLIKRLQLQCRGILKFCCIGAFVSLCLLFVFIIRCENPSFAGVNVPYKNATGNICNSQCHCQSSEYDPICSADGVIYFSPCSAGCEQAYKTDTSKVYSNCSCIDSGKWMTLEGAQVFVQAEREKCPSKCNLLSVFLVIIFFCMFFTFVIVTPSLQVTLRCVADSQKSFALGVQWIFIRVLGSIPGPIVVGALIDRSCNYWQELCDGGQGSCRSYDNYVLSVTLAIVAFTSKSLSVTMFALALFTYKPPNNNNSSSSPKGEATPETPSSMGHTPLPTVCSRIDDRDNKESVNGISFKTIAVG